MEIQLSVSAHKPERDLATSLSGDVGGAMTAAQVTAVAQGLVTKLQGSSAPIMSERSLRAAASTAVNNWVTRSKTTEFSKAAKQQAATKLVNRVVALFSKGAAPKKAGPKQPAGFSAPNGTGAKAKKMSKDEIAEVADRLSYAVKFKGSVDSKTKDDAINRIVGDWTGKHSVKYPNATRLLNQSLVSKKLVELINKKADLVASDKGNSGSVSAAEVTTIAQSLLPKLKSSLKGVVNAQSLKAAASRVAARWVNADNKDYNQGVRLGLENRIIARLVSLHAKGEPKAAPVNVPSDKVVPTTKAATKEEKQKAQILTATKLRNQFQGMLAKAPPMTAKSIENIRKHCVAYSKVITSVQRGNEALAETTKIEGLRGIDSVKKYVDVISGLTYGYVELAKNLGVTQTALGEKIRNKITVETPNVELKRTARLNAQRCLEPVAKALHRRECELPTSFQRAVEKVFVEAAVSEDYKSAKVSIRGLIDNLVADVFSNKAKMHKAK